MMCCSLDEVIGYPNIRPDCIIYLTKLTLTPCLLEIHTGNPPSTAVLLADPISKIRCSLMERSLGADPTEEPLPFAKWRSDVARAFQYYLDKSNPHYLGRWIGTFVVLSTYVLRVYLIEGFYIVSYGLGIYLLNLMIGFLSPKVDPEIEVMDGASLPMKGSDEFKPFIRRLPEFKFWYSITKAFCLAFVMTFFSVFDIPVFWPILLFYWIVLFFLTMKRQIMHMIKYKYIPFSTGKKRYTAKKDSASSNLSKN
ncbi:putative Rer1 protein [Zostera marina]|uniref:Putative Rer1 protein n=1 Tax=Zostera marina TaxID=29655 RepID=A0A0K9NJN2_ZOSMR|nr:putative Rer1 protein [Zostera marina]